MALCFGATAQPFGWAHVTLLPAPELVELLG
jgi:hypothetical protein